MSFLDSVLSSIGKGGSTPVPTPPKVVPVKKPETSTNTSVKRKAEEELERNVDKPKRVERTNTLRPDDRSIRSVAPPKQNGSTPTAPAGTSTPVTSNKNPKKGSFAAIMARAKEAQAAPANLTGTITHKPKEKNRNRRDILMEREMAKKAAKKGVPLRTPPSNRDGTREDVKKSASEQKNAGTVKSGYQGTMKQSEKSGYQGTMKSSTSSGYSGTAKPSSYSGTAAKGNSRDSGINRSKQVPSRGRSDYDDSDDYGSEDGYDYASEDYSDMDAGFDDMEEEEEQAARIARKEDAAAQAELDRLKREKERKKASLLKGNR